MGRTTNKNWILRNLGVSDVVEPSDLTSYAIKGTDDNFVSDAQLSAIDNIPSIAGLESSSNKSTNVTTDAASDTMYPSVKAVKTYADNLVSNLLDYRGVYDASINTFPATGGSGTDGAILKGDAWAVSVAGTLGTDPVQIGDMLIANVDTPGQTASKWNKLNGNVSYAPEDTANKITTLSAQSTDVQFPSAKLLYDQLLLAKKRYVVIPVLAPDANQTASDSIQVGSTFESSITGTILSVGAFSETAGVTGTAIYDIHLNGASIMTTTKISIESEELSSRDATTQPVLTTTAIAIGNRLTFFSDSIHSGTPAKGLSFFLNIQE